MKTFKFYHKQTWDIVTLTANTRHEAIKMLNQTRVAKDYCLIEPKKTKQSYYSLTMGDYEYKYLNK